MHTVRMTRDHGGWFAEVDGRQRYGYKRLTDAIRQAGRAIGDESPPGQSPSVEWLWTDDFMHEASAVAEERRKLKATEARVTQLTNDSIVKLARNGLNNGDIAAILGLTASRVSQIVQDTAEWLWGTNSASAETTVVKLWFGEGWRAVKGYGPAPTEIRYSGQTFRANGFASSVGGRPLIQSYVPLD